MTPEQERAVETRLRHHLGEAANPVAARARAAAELVDLSGIPVADARAAVEAAFGRMHPGRTEQQENPAGHGMNGHAPPDSEGTGSTSAHGMNGQYKPFDPETYYLTEKAKEAARRRVKRELDAETLATGWQKPTALEFPGTLADSLKRPRPEQRYLIDGLWGTAHNLSIEAMFKTGKTTLLAAAAGSLADGTPFLGFAGVHPPAGTVAVWNAEMDADEFDDYLLPHVARQDRIVPAHLRWRPVPLMTSKPDRDMTVSWLRYHGAQVWIIDTWSRLCAWNGIDPSDNAAVATLTAYVDEIKHEAGVTAMAVTAHMPHAARRDRTFERGFGAQTFSGWVDAMWRYTRDGDNRYLSADGRKVRLEECQVFMDGNGRLTAAAGNRDNTAGQTLEYALLSVIRMHPGISTSQAARATGKRKEDGLAVLGDLLRRGLVRCAKPERQGQAAQWYPADQA